MQKLVIAAIAALSLCWLALQPSLVRAGEALRTVEGSVTYRQRIALPPDAYAIVEARDAVGRVIAQARVDANGRQVPLPFRLELPAGVALSLRAAIHVGGQVRWRGGPVELSADRESGGPIVIVVNAAPSSPSVGGDRVALLAGPDWRVEDIMGGGIIDRSHLTLQFGPDGRVAGTAGCNRYTASYTLTGDRLRIGSAAATMMACVSPALMEQERRFFDALSKVAAFDIDGTGALRLKAGDGATLLLARRP